MTEERRYLTHEDYPDILLPCYITSTGEVWQWSNREKKMTKRKVCYDKIHDKAFVNLSNDENAKHWSRSIPLAANVYKYFGEDRDIKQKIHHIGYRDGDVMNCNIDNLYKREVRYNKNPRVRKPRVKKPRVSKKSTASRPDVECKKPVVETPVVDDHVIPDIFGIQTDTMRVVLSDIESVYTFLDMKRAYSKKVLSETKATIDTTDWTADDLRKLLKLRKVLDDTIIK